MAVYLFSVTALGMFMATLAPSMPQFGLFAVPVYAIAYLLSGAATPIESMPPVLQSLAGVLPTTQFVTLSKAILYRGAGIDVIWPQMLAIAGWGSLFRYAGGATLPRDAGATGMSLERKGISMARHSRPASVLMVLALPLAACVHAPATEPHRAPVTPPAAFAGIDGAAPEQAVPFDHWWTLWGDPALDAQVERTLAANQDIRIAMARARRTCHGGGGRIRALSDHCRQWRGLGHGCERHYRRFAGAASGCKS
jgi:hypothetical protein